MKKHVLKILSIITLIMIIFTFFYPTINYANSIMQDEFSQEKGPEAKIEQEQEKEEEPEQINENEEEASTYTNKLENSKIEDGNYYIETALKPNKVISIENGRYNNFANAHLWDNLNKEYQKFELKYDTKLEAYIITALHSNKSLDVPYAGQENGTNVSQYDTHKDTSEQWLLQDAGDGYYYIVSKCNNLYLDIESAQTGNGTNIQMYEGNGTKAQKFKFIKIEDIEKRQTIEDGIYNITTKINNNKVFDIENKYEKVKIANKLNVINKKQAFEIKYLNNGYYSIKASKYGYNLEVENGSQANCAKIVQNPSNDNLTTQQWIIKKTEDGYYSIISRCNGLYIDIPGGRLDDNPEINMYEGNGTDAQKFKFEKVEIKSDKIEDGNYYIETALKPNKVISIEDGRYNNFANVQLWDKLNKEYQKFELKYDTNLEAYIITALHSDKSLDVPYAGQENGTNVSQYDTHKDTSEQWILQEAGDGYYYIVSKCNNLYLDIESAQTGNGTNIQMYEGNETKAQKFKFIKIEDTEEKQTIEDGIYNIAAKVNNNKVFAVESEKVKIADKLDVINKKQAFEIKYLNNGYYLIKASKYGYNLEVENGSQANCTKIVQNPSNDNLTTQQWIIKETEDGYYNIISRCNGLYIDIPGGRLDENTEINMYEGNGTDAQKFKFEKATQEMKGQRLLDDGIYKINTALSSTKYIDISAGSYSNGANVQIWDKDNVQQQKFQLKYNETEKYYEIKSVNSGKVLDVQSNGKSDGTNVYQYDSNNSDAQKWILQDAGNGYYYIIAVNSYLYLDVNAGSSNNGANIQIYEGNATNSQKFKFEKTTMIDSKTYNIEIKKDTTKVLDVDAGSQKEGANIQIWEFDNVNQQALKIEYIDDTYCKIIARHSGKVLTVRNQNVVQEEYKDIDEQKWSFEIAGNGYYKIKSKVSDLYLDIEGSKIQNGANIKVNKKSSSDTQEFRFRKVQIEYGIDVSHHQKIIDWEKVKKSGVDFVIIRVGYGQDQLAQDDKYFERNVSECERLGIPYGFYLYSYATNVDNALSEADHMLRLAKGHNPTYGIWYDLEEDDKNADFINIATAFCEKIKANGYKDVGIYANLYWWNEKLNDSRLEIYPKWVAEWNDNCTYTKPLKMWQYTENGSVDGIDGNVDMNILYK